jgi:hypothetical protein
MLKRLGNRYALLYQHLCPCFGSFLKAYINAAKTSVIAVKALNFMNRNFHLVAKRSYKVWLDMNFTGILFSRSEEIHLLKLLFMGLITSF